MNFKIRSLAAVAAALFLYGCASAPEPVYMTQAEQVTTLALEPVSVTSYALKGDVKEKFGRLAGAERVPEIVDTIMSDINEQIARTKRFTKVMASDSTIIDGENYTIVPRIESLTSFEKALPTDPTRKVMSFKAKVRLDVKFMNQKGQEELVKSYADLRTLDKRVPAKLPVSDAEKVEYFKEVIDVAYKAAANLLGVAFNPSYEMGKVSRLNGKTAHVQINTSKLRKMPKKAQAVEVIDDNNNVLATVAELTVGDGSLSGRVYEKSGATIKEGSRVRARVNGLTE